MNVKEKLGLKIKELRLKKGWSQEKLALESNLDRTYLTSIENGRTEILNPTEIHSQKIVTKGAYTLLMAMKNKED